MSDIQISIKGMDKLKKKYRGAHRILQSELQEAASISGLKIQNTARRNAPRQTGNLRRRIEAYPFRKFGMKVEPRAEYSDFVEFGTRFMRAQPYMRPALQSSLPYIKKAFQRALSNVAKRLN